MNMLMVNTYMFAIIMPFVRFAFHCQPATSTHAYSAELSQAPVTTNLRICNLTENSFEIVVDNTYLGTCPPGTLKPISVSIPSDRKRSSPSSDQDQLCDVSIIAAGTGISQIKHDRVIQISGIRLLVDRSDTIDIVWGGLMPPSHADTNHESAVDYTDKHSNIRQYVEIDTKIPQKFGELCNWRLAGLLKREPGRPFPHEETLIGTTWREQRVEGGMLSVGTYSSVDDSFLQGYATNQVGMLFVNIPRGSFTDAQNARSRIVTLSKDFYMSVTETTRAQWAIANNTPIPNLAEQDLPIAEINWAQAMSYRDVLPTIPGWAYTLPTEAQWEYSARSGTTTPYNPSNVDASKVMWYAVNAGGHTHPTGRLLPNAFGLFDMFGNVDEWCRTWRGRNSPNGVDPSGPNSDWWRASRGGSYLQPKEWCTVFERNGAAPSAAFDMRGFRSVIERTNTQDSP